MKKIKSIVREHHNSFTFDCYLKAITFAEYHARAETLLKAWLKKKKIKYPNFINQLPSYTSLSDAESLSPNNSKPQSSANDSSPPSDDEAPSKKSKIVLPKNVFDQKKKAPTTSSSGNPSIKARANKFAEDKPGGYHDYLEPDQNVFLGGKDSQSLSQKKIRGGG